MKRPIRIKGDVAYVPLTKGYTAVIDAADVPAIGQNAWAACVQGVNVYAVQGVGPRACHKTIAMHRLLLPPVNGLVVDHIDGDGLNNRRANLRLVTRGQNNMNRHALHGRNTSGAKGVYWHKAAQKWAASIQAEGKSQHLGLFVEMEDAIAAYNAASQEMHGVYGAPSGKRDPSGSFVAAVIAADPNAIRILGRSA